MIEENNELKTLSNSIKAKLYDSAYTPFMSSFIIAWIIINHKYLLVYFSDTKIDEKLKILDSFHKKSLMNYQDTALIDTHFLGISTHFFWYPLCVALFYVYVYPHISNLFYKYTGERNNEKKLIKIAYENKRAIDEEEKEAIFLENYNLTTKINKLKTEITRLESKYKREREKDETKIKNLLGLKQELENQLQEHNRLIEINEKHIAIINELKKKNKNLEQKINDKKQHLLEKEQEFIDRFSIDNDSFNILKIIYTNSIQSTVENSYVGLIKNYIDWSSFRISKSLHTLVESKLLRVSYDNKRGSAGYYDINKKYIEDIMGVFEE